MHNLDDVVIKLHECARKVEREVGQGKLSEDIRACADRLSRLLAPLPATKD